MPSVCGMACEICVFSERGMCPVNQCVAGTDPKAPEKLERYKAVTGNPCLILECAIKKNIAYCSRCNEFPCEVHYKKELFSKNTLDMLKSILKKK
jgi:hypothetical protein